MDVCDHASDVYAATAKKVFRIENDELQPVSKQATRIPIEGIASYSETIYVRHRDRIGFLQEGKFEYEDVQDWGQLPRNSVTRDMMAFGPRMFVSTNKGLAELRGMTWTIITGKQGLCYEDTTCVAQGFDRDYWIGTKRGAIRAAQCQYITDRE